jgi:hypothetical protein
VFVLIVLLAIGLAVWNSQAQDVPQGSASGAVAVVNGHVIVALTDLLQKGAGTPIAGKTQVPLARPYSGPDAALLRLQADAIALGLEALGTVPATPKRSEGGPERRAAPTH